MRVIVYHRTSATDGDVSVEEGLACCRAQAVGRGWPVVGELKDDSPRVDVAGLGSRSSAGGWLTEPPTP